jgi:hypothetical protein
MKTIGRILIILAVFSIFAGLMVTVVNASGANAPDFNGAPQFRPEGNDGGVRPQGDANRPERGERDGGGLRWLSGAIKNVAVIGFLVTVIAWPKSIVKKKKKTAAAITANGKS